MSCDQPLNPEHTNEARAIMHELKFVSDIEFPRRAICNNQDLHVFVDASNRAYGTAVYTVSWEY